MGSTPATPPDPIAPVITALSFLVTPNPATIAATPQPPSTWEGGAATDGSLYTPIQGLLSAVFSISALSSVGGAVNTALTDVAKVITTIADQLSNLATSLPAGASATDIMNGLQSALTLAGTMLPGGATSAASSALSSAGQLFSTLQNLITAVGGDLAKAAAELAQLSQQLTALAALFT